MNKKYLTEDDIREIAKHLAWYVVWALVFFAIVNTYV